VTSGCCCCFILFCFVVVEEASDGVVDVSKTLNEVVVKISRQLNRDPAFGQARFLSNCL